MLDLKYMTLTGWVFAGLITPEIPAPKAGSPAYFTRKNIHEIAILQKMVKAGIKRQMAKKVMDDSKMKAKILANNEIKYTFTINVTIPNY